MESIKTNNSQEDKMLVRDIQCEECVLGTILTREGAFFDAAEFIDSDCFFDMRNREIYEAIKRVIDKGNKPDIITVYAELASVGSSIQPYVIASIADHYISDDLTYYAIRLKDLAYRRRMWEIAQQFMLAGTDESRNIDDIRQMALDGINGMFKEEKNIFTLGDSLILMNENISKNLGGGTDITGTPTGFKRFDKKGGLQKSDLVIIAAETSQGKTSLALNILSYAIRSGAKAAMYSLEMNKQQLSARLVSSLSGIPSSTILYSSYINGGDLMKIDEAIGMLPGDRLFFDDSSTSNIESILLSIRTMKLKYDIDGVCVDYLQIISISDKRMTREQQMADASRRLKNIAKELDIWVILVSQLSRDSTNPVPNLNRLRDSGQIAEAADVVILIYRPEACHRENYPSPYDDATQFPIEGTAMIDVAKGRNIGTFQFFLGFRRETTTFYENEMTEHEVVPIESSEEDAPF